MKYLFIKYVLIFNIINIIISFGKNDKDYLPGKLLLNINNTYKSEFNFSLHEILNYQYLFKFNFSTNFTYDNISIINKNNIHINITYRNKNLDIYFFDNEDSIINLILNKSIDSILLFDYLIFSQNNLSKNIGESLSYQLFYINKSSFNSIINFLKADYNNNNYNSLISINIFYDNTYKLIPYDFIIFSMKIPFLSIALLILINQIFFKKGRYYNLCFNSSILRIIFSIIYILIGREKLKYNKNKFVYLSGLSIESYMDSINNLLNDIYLSFIFCSMLFIINNELSITKFFNSSDRKIKIYFSLFLFLSLINIPNYLINQSPDISSIDIIFLKIKVIIYGILKIFLFLYFIKKQMKIISQVLFFYSIYHIINNVNYLIFKKVILKHIRFFFIIFIFFNIYLRELSFRK